MEHPKNLSILYVERDMISKPFMLSILNRSVASVFFATTTVQALHALALYRPDLILTELWLPDPSDGARMVREIQLRYPDIPLFIHSWEHPHRYGLLVDGYLPKPLVLGELETVFDDILTYKYLTGG